MNKVLVTGANGFVGNALLPALKSRGWSLRAAVRGSASRIPLADGDTEYVQSGPLGVSSDLSAALAGVDRVVHLAGWAGGAQRRTGAELGGANVEGSASLATQCISMGVKRLIYLSSAKVYGESSRQRPFRAFDPPAPQTAYARSKLEAERALWRIAAGSSLEVVVIRAPLIYGPRVSGNFLRLLRLCHSGVPLPFASVNNRRSMLAIGNLCDLIDLCLRSPAAAGRVLLASDGRDLSTRALIVALRELFELPGRMVPCPVAMLRLGALLAGKRTEVDRLVESLRLDLTATREILGWRPPISIEDALADTVTWYRARTFEASAEYRQAFDRHVP